MSTDVLLQQRLLRDINELVRNPYPRIRLHPRGDDLSQACLVLDTEAFGTLHFTVQYGARYPLVEPIITIQNEILHRNVDWHWSRGLSLGSICLWDLDTAGQNYTPAYTLKSIAIQLLSLFSSDQDKIDRRNKSMADISQMSMAIFFATMKSRDFKEKTSPLEGWSDKYTCQHCGCGKPDECSNPENADTSGAQNDAFASAVSNPALCPIDGLPTELLLRIMEELEHEDLMRFRKAWIRADEIATDFDLVHMRDLVCYVSAALLSFDGIPTYRA